MKVFQILVNGSDEEKQFINNLIQVIKNVNTTSIHDIKSLEEIVQYLASKIKKYGLNIQRWSILQDTLKPGEIKTVTIH